MNSFMPKLDCVTLRPLCQFERHHTFKMVVWRGEKKAPKVSIVFFFHKIKNILMWCKVSFLYAPQIWHRSMLFNVRKFIGPIEKLFNNKLMVVLDRLNFGVFFLNISVILMIQGRSRAAESISMDYTVTFFILFLYCYDF